MIIRNSIDLLSKKIKNMFTFDTNHTFQDYLIFVSSHFGNSSFMVISTTNKADKSTKNLTNFFFITL